MAGDLDKKRGRDAARGENLEASDTIKETCLIRKEGSVRLLGGCGLSQTRKSFCSAKCVPTDFQLLDSS
jgi:hypothetical protein